MIKKEVPVAGVGTFSLCPFKDKVIVELDPINRFDDMQPVTVFWDQMTDMEVMYEKFQDLRMKAFKPVAEALGVMYSNRQLYEALIE